MNKWKKAISAGMSVALLASLFTMTAGTALAAATDYSFTVTGAGSIPTTGTSGAVTIAVGETQATGWDAAGNTLTFTLNDAAGAAGTVAWAGSPTVTGAPGSLGTFTVSSAANVLTVKFTSSNTAQIENFSITGATIKTTGAAAGGIRVFVAKTAGVGTGTIPTGTGTASGVITADTAAPAAALAVTYDLGSFPFAVTGVTNGNLQIAAPDAEARAITGVAPVGGPPPVTDTLTLATPTAAFHAADTVVTQSVQVAGLITGIATVVNNLVQTATGANIIQPGENNQATGSTAVTETAAGTLATNSVVKFTLAPAGVLFSASPTVTPTGAALALNGLAAGTAAPCSLSFDRTFCTVTVTTKSTAAGTLTLSGILVDVAASVAQGTSVTVAVTTTPAVPVVVDDDVIARVGRIVVTTGAQPTIFINENDQPSGMITITESSAGTFTAGATNNYIALCLATGESFTRAPFAVVTAGDLKLRDGAVAGTSVRGTLYTSSGVAINVAPGVVIADNTLAGQSCVYWIVWSKSTTASTVEIRGSDSADAVLASGPENGPRLSVGAGLIPGTTQTRVLNSGQGYVLDLASITQFAGTTRGVLNNTGLLTISSNALRTYRNQPVVAAVSVPVIQKGASDALLGNLTITETQAGQFKAGESCTVTLQPQSQPAGTTSVVRFRTATSTADLPIIGTNSASGLLTGSSSFPSTTVFGFTINQQATGTLGVITISNMHVFVLGDAAPAFVQVRVQCSGGGSVALDQTVTNARIGAVSVAEATINRGLNTRTGFGFATESVARGSYVTIRSRASGSAAGDLVQIWVKTKTTAWKLETSRRVSPNGFMYYSGKVLNAGYRYYRVVYPTGAVSNTVRAFGR